jgi:putative ABC transport system substrate-binding protein
MPAPTPTRAHPKPSPGAVTPVVTQTRPEVISTPVPITPTVQAPPTVPPTPTPTVGPRRVLLLQSDARVAINREIASSLLGRLPARVELRDLAGDREQGVKVAREASAGADLVVAVGSLASAVSREAISNVPVLFCAALNPRRFDLPTANAAGVRFELSAAAQLSRLKAALPTVRRVGVIFDPSKSKALVEEAEQAASAVGLQIVTAEIQDPRNVDFVFRSLRKDIDVLWVIPDSTVVTRETWPIIALQAAENKIPLMAFSESFVQEGALLAFYTEPSALAEQCANLATRLLRGETSPAEIGIRAPETVHVAVNRRVEEQLGLTLAPTFRPDREYR